MGCGSSVPADGPGPAPRPAKGTDGSGTTQGKATNGVGGDGTVVATVAEVRQETSAVKLLRLRVPTKSTEGGEFAFRPGQWVDFYAPGVDKPGGYSIASSPGQLARDGTFDVACKQSRTQGTSHWIHDGAKPGDEVRVRVGGTFFMATEDADAPLLMVAGGIGISPLCAMLETLLERERDSLTTARGCAGRGRVGRERCLRTSQEAPAGGVAVQREDRARPERQGAGYGAEKRRRLRMCLSPNRRGAKYRRRQGAVRGHDHRGAPRAPSIGGHGPRPGHDDQAGARRPGGGEFNREFNPRPVDAGEFNREAKKDASAASEAEQWDDSDTCGQGAITRDGRIDKKALERAIDRLRAAAVSEGRSGTDVVAFLCGPPKMSDATEKTLLKLGLPKRSVRLERWW